nr:BREX system P-loop protein BrxC [Bacillus pacificus]
NISSIKEVVQEKVDELQKRIEQMQNLESISRVYTYTQMANNDYRRLEGRVNELYKDYVDDQDVQYVPGGTDQIKTVEMSASHLKADAIPDGQVEIENSQALKQWLKKLEDAVNKELNQGKTVQIKK